MFYFICVIFNVIFSLIFLCVLLIKLHIYKTLLSNKGFAPLLYFYIFSNRSLFSPFFPLKYFFYYSFKNHSNITFINHLLFHFTCDASDANHLFSYFILFHSSSISTHTDVCFYFYYIITHKFFFSIFFNINRLIN